jgi:hypothetical protein
MAQSMRTVQWLLGLWISLGMVGAARGQVQIQLVEEKEQVLRIAPDTYVVRPMEQKATVNVRLLLPKKSIADNFTLMSLEFETGATLENKTKTFADTEKTYVERIDYGLKLSNLQNRQEIPITAVVKLKPSDSNLPEKPLKTLNQVRLIVDSEGPILTVPNATRSAGDSIEVQIAVSDDIDLDSLNEENFRVLLGGTKEPLKIIGDPVYMRAGSTVELTFIGKGAGTYEVYYKDLKDRLGNPNAKTNLEAMGDWKPQGKLSFTIPSGPDPARRGLRIDYPEYVGPEGRPTTYFNPHEKVDSRVIRLYYFRDANRVVQIINRDVQQLNLSRVNYESGLAIDAREKADDATADRRYNEQQAIQVVQKARAARREIEKQEAVIARSRSAKAKLSERKRSAEAALTTGKDPVLPPLPGEVQDHIDALNRENTQIEAQISALNAESKADPTKSAANDARVADLGSQKTRNSREISQLQSEETFRSAQYKAELEAEKDTVEEQIAIVNETIQAAQVAISAANAELSRAQVEESQNTLKVLTSQDREDRARAKQFRQEVIAGTTDRDTYAPGDVKSVDPVQQVSLSVIGEGVIQLRGPSKGINKIARLIHQIDTPVGQVKVGIQTVQINGEHGDRMEYVYERIDKHIAQARFLTNESLQLFRRAVQEVASEVALQIDEGFIPPDMDEWSADCARLTGSNLHQWRYVNAFFGGDFIRELREMDSELLKHDNKLLSLHSMDTISLAGALYVSAVAKHSVRMMILDRFMGFVQSELPRKEVDYYRALTRVRHADPCVNHIMMEHFGQKNDLKDATRIWEKALRTYQFSNFVGFFDMQLSGEDTLNNVQHATIRMAQALKAQLVAELEFKNLVLEKSLLERREGELAERLGQLQVLSEQLAQTSVQSRDQERNARAEFRNAVRRVVSRINSRSVAAIMPASDALQNNTEFVKDGSNSETSSSETDNAASESKGSEPKRGSGRPCPPSKQDNQQNAKTKRDAAAMKKSLTKIGASMPRLEKIEDPIQLRIVADRLLLVDQLKVDYLKCVVERLAVTRAQDEATTALLETYERVDARDVLPSQFATDSLEVVLDRLHIAMTGANQLRFVTGKLEAIKTPPANLATVTQFVTALANQVDERWTKYANELRTELGEEVLKIDGLQETAGDLYAINQRLQDTNQRLEEIEQQVKEARDNVLAGRVLDEAIDETELKAVELLEATRAHVANVDNYLKRLAVALEDDVMAQFYNPAMMDVRRASRYWDVTLSQVENTTVLTNNRSFAKVSPTATMELDLPSRQILITEAVRGGKALATEYGNLLKDPTFLAAASISAGRPPLGLNSRQSFLQGIQDPIDGAYGNPRPEFGAALEGLIPDPAVYKFETGTGYEIRPVIQPDGHSIVYTFDYMYTTNVREPVRADEKHLGRVKRHFVHTDVQTSSYEMREVSRYNVALKASRTARGVPLLEDVPGVGALFRPLPNQESSLQQNIIYGTSTIYPTLFDLMGLRWSPYAEDLHSERLAKSKPREREISNRYRSVLLRKARNAVREDIGADFELPAELPSDYREPELEQEMLPNGPRVPATRSRGGMGDDMGSQSAARSRPARTAQRESISPGLPVRSTTPRATGRVPNPREPGSDLDEPSAAGRPQLAPPNRSGAARQRRSDIQLAAATEEAEPPPRRLKKPEEVSPPARPGKSRMATSRPTTVRSAAVENSHAEEVTPAAKPKAWSQWFKK